MQKETKLKLKRIYNLIVIIILFCINISEYALKFHETIEINMLLVHTDWPTKLVIVLQIISAFMWQIELILQQKSANHRTFSIIQPIFSAKQGWYLFI